MKQFNNIKEILGKVYASDITVAGLSPFVQRHNKFLVIPGQHGPRWVVPYYSSVGKTVLRQWKPYNLMSRLKWQGLISMYSMGVLGRIPGVSCIKINSEKSLQIPERKSALIPIVYIGTPGPRQKAVVILFSPDTNKSEAVMKVALSDGAIPSLLHEAVILEKLAERNIPNVPKLLAVGEKKDRTWQTVVNGRLTGRKLTSSHINWLLQQSRSERITTLDEQQELLQHQIKEDHYLPDRYKEAVCYSVDMIRGRRQIPLILVHGDFAPWNLKWLNEKKIGAIDWEDAQLESLPLWDLCHFYFMQAYLFRDLNPVKELTTSPVIQLYIKQIGIGKNEFFALMLLYILLKIFSRESTANKAYRKFLLRQIKQIIIV